MDAKTLIDGAKALGCYNPVGDILRLSRFQIAAIREWDAKLPDKSGYELDAIEYRSSYKSERA